MTAKKEKSISLEFRISNIELIEKSFHIPLPKGNNFPNPQFELAINVSVDKPNKSIINILGVNVKSADDNSIVASIKVLCKFEITNFEDVVILSNDLMTIPDPIIETLNIITIGTTRGIMFNEFKGTWLHNAILPVIDPKSFKQENENKVAEP